MRNTISFDIDGVLNNYPKCWLDYLFLATGSKFKTVSDAKSTLKSEYAYFKDKYRNSIYKENLVFNDDALELNADLVKRGCHIIVSTSRPITDERYPDLFGLTERWLIKNGFSFQKLLSKYEVLNRPDLLSTINYHIDDEKKFCMLFEERGVKSYLLNRQANKPNKNQISSLIDLVGSN